MTGRTGRHYLSREAAGDLLFGFLTENDATRAEACETLGMTDSQFYTALEYIRDTLAGARTSPVIYDPKTYRYSLALSEVSQGAVRDYEIHRLRCMATQLRRLRTGTAAPAARLWDQNVNIRRLLRHLEGAEEELDLLLAELSA
jgi:hypothetical protein